MNHKVKRLRFVVRQANKTLKIKPYSQVTPTVQGASLLKVTILSLLLFFAAIVYKQRNMSHIEKIWLIDVFLTVFVQTLRPIAQRNKIYQALDTYTILASRMNSLLIWLCTWHLLRVRKLENYQLYPSSKLLAYLLSGNLVPLLLLSASPPRGSELPLES